MYVSCWLKRAVLIQRDDEKCQKETLTAAASRAAETTDLGDGAECLTKAR